MADAFRYEIPKADAQKVDQLYNEILKTGKLPKELAGNDIQTRLLALTIVGKAISEQKANPIEQPPRQQFGFTYSSLYDPKDIGGQKVLALLSTKFADAITESRMLQPNGIFDRTLTGYLKTHPAVTLALIANAQKTPQEMRKLIQPLGPRKSEASGDFGIDNFLVSRSGETEQKLFEWKRNFTNISLSLIPFLPELKERNDRLNDALYNPSANNLLAAVESQQAMPDKMVMASIFAFFTIAVPMTKFGSAAKGILVLAREDQAMSAIIVGCSRGIREGRELQRLCSTISLDDVKAFMRMNPELRNSFAADIVGRFRDPAWHMAYNELKLAYQAPLRLALEGRATSYESLVEKYASKFHAKVGGDAGNLLQFGKFPDGAWGMKVHIMLPSFNPAEHSQMADAVIEKLSALRDEVGGGMAFKFMKSAAAGRMKGTQLGKDLTVYFSDYVSYKKALSGMYDISDMLSSSGRSMVDLMNNPGIEAISGSKLQNLFNELKIAPFITGSIRSDDAARVFILSEKDVLNMARGLDAAHREIFMQEIQPLLSSGNYKFNDKFLRTASTEVNTVLFEAYQKGLLSAR